MRKTSGGQSSELIHQVIIEQITSGINCYALLTCYLKIFLAKKWMHWELHSTEGKKLFSHLGVTEREDGSILQTYL